MGKETEVEFPEQRDQGRKKEVQKRDHTNHVKSKRGSRGPLIGSSPGKMKYRV